MAELAGKSQRETKPSRRTSRRPDIQGLRAVAVLAVIAFHAGLPLPGGFVGVDVFFVISGFVITEMLQREQDRTGRIDFKRFYSRRFKRLTPALALMVSVTLIFVGLFMSSGGTAETAAQTGIGAVLMLANFVIARTTGNYFDQSAELNPMLHTWSLSVEEQFYLVFPTLLALSWIVGRRMKTSMRIPLLAVVTTTSISLLLALILAVSDKATPNFIEQIPQVGSWLSGFYSPVTRAWEFGVGALIALVLSSHKLVMPPFARKLLGFIGVAMVAASFVLISEATPFPGSWTLLPVTGTALLIAVGSMGGGSATSSQSPVTRILGTRPLVQIGDWSYSLYLWHWPFIVFAVYLYPSLTWAPLLAALVSCMPALIAFYGVEQRLRFATINSKRVWGLLIAVTLLIPIGMGSYILLVGNAREKSYGYEGNEEFFARMNSTYYPCSERVSNLVDDEYGGIQRCFRSQPNDNYDVIIFGDSTAEHLFPGVAKLLPNKNVLYLLNPGASATDTKGSSLVGLIDESKGVTDVIYAGKWESGFIDGSVRDDIVDSVKALEGENRHVVVVEGAPTFPLQGYDCAFPAPLGPAKCVEPDPLAAGMGQDQLMEWFANDENVKVVATRALFCNAGECRMNPEGKVLYRDGVHLNFEGSELIAPVIFEGLRSPPG